MPTNADRSCLVVSALLQRVPHLPGDGAACIVLALAQALMKRRM